jgi:hypothetical protein
MGDGTFEILYSRERTEKHVMGSNNPDYTSECDFDIPRQIIKYDPWYFPFALEYCIDMLPLRTN